MESRRWHPVFNLNPIPADAKLHAMKPPLVIGIVGGSGSGKTTLARGLQALTERYGNVLISQDSYYRGLAAGTDARGYNFDEPAALDLDLLAEHVRQLKAGRPIDMPRYDFAAHRRRAETERVSPAALIIVEGLFLYTLPALRSLFDLRFYVDVPAAERLRRRIDRDVRERGRTAPEVVAQFTQQVEPMGVRHIEPTRRHAHAVLDLPHPDDRLYCEQVVDMWRRIEERLERKP